MQITKVKFKSTIESKTLYNITHLLPYYTMLNLYVLLSLSKDIKRLFESSPAHARAHSRAVYAHEHRRTRAHTDEK